MFKNLLMVISLLFITTGCEDKEEIAKLEQAKKDAQLAKQQRAEQLKKLQEDQVAKESKLKSAGISMEDGTITIDTDKTKEFISELSKKVSKQVEQVSKDLQDGLVDNNNSGELKKEYISIDLNKTKAMLNEWENKIETFVNEIDTKKIETH